MRVGTMNPWHLTTKRRICLDMLLSPPTNSKPLTPATNCHRGHDMRLLDVQISTKRQFGSFPQAWEPKIEGRWSEYHSTTIDAVHHHTNPNFSNSLVVPCVLRLALQCPPECGSD
ncbi:hypothetical protein CTAM01_13981 [Colletotrichum tamarilloi]|uniref:Uncharacterized protein n=1 Tax=Colletotrichum tamarilloi TaxID=1209934 RepID=A0ABQ9QQF3_9PEZI|nr:uncharacterized protein CTAM01_13981 [Colletotrichum tamarilloi]KAK1481513.1 hypothetical protein CTAM01_13981 [Colletotrichum tamarilloi]